LLTFPDILDRVVFIESFSKSHGLCRERLGVYFSANEKLFTALHTANIAFSAGPGRVKDFQFEALGSKTERCHRGVESLHLFWRDERKGLLQFLLQPQYADLFEQTQEHIRADDIDKPCTLYLLLKTKPGVKAQDVLFRTGALGVDTQMGSGHYIRFSVGQLLEPTYTKYAL
jgi:hypothetical protein